MVMVPMSLVFRVNISKAKVLESDQGNTISTLLAKCNTTAERVLDLALGPKLVLVLVTTPVDLYAQPKLAQCTKAENSRAVQARRDITRTNTAKVLVLLLHVQFQQAKLQATTTFTKIDVYY